MSEVLDLGKVAQARRYESISGAAEDTIAFGKGVMEGTDEEKQFKAYDGSENVVIKGLAMFTNSGNIDDLEFVENQPMRVLRKGTITTQVAADVGDVSAGDRVALAGDGWVMKASEAESTTDGSDHAAVLANAEFVTGGSAGDSVVVEVNFPMEVTFEDQSS